MELEVKMECRLKCFVSSHNQQKGNNQFKHQNNQKCQNIKLHGSPTTKELKKHSLRLVEGPETASQGREDAQQGGKMPVKVGAG